MAFLLSVAAWGQLIPFPSFGMFQQLRSYLQLTDAQWNTINTNNRQYSQLVFERQQRISIVQLEIAQETLNPTLDAMALGMRYAEIEGICRDLRQRGADLERTNVQVLTDAQRGKLKTLQDALNLLPVISEAQGAGLLESGPGERVPAGIVARTPIPSLVFTSAPGGVLGFGASPGGCALPAVATNPFVYGLAGAQTQNAPRTPQKWFDMTEFKQ